MLLFISHGSGGFGTICTNNKKISKLQKESKKRIKNCIYYVFIAKIAYIIMQKFSDPSSSILIIYKLL